MFHFQPWCNLKRTIRVVKEKTPDAPVMYWSIPIKIVFACNIGSLCVDISYRFIVLTFATAAWLKALFQAAGTHGIENGGIVAGCQVSSPCV
jgi:hypothetical protein